MIELVGQSDRVSGWKAYRCDNCGDVIHSPYGADRVVCTCPSKDWLSVFADAYGISRVSALVKSLLSPAEVAELLPDEDPTLIGNRIAALTEALGIPPCGACNNRRQWMNAAHDLIRRSLSQKVT